MIRLRLVLGLCAACALGMAGLQPRPLHAASAVPSVSIRHVNALNFGVVVDDFNGDGYVDLVATEPWTDGPPYMTIALGQSGGGFGAATRIACVCRPLAAADFNGDGKLDLVVEEMPEPDVDVLALQGNGDGTFTRPLNSVSRVAQPYSVYFGLAADMNGDGKQDVVLAVDADGTNPKILVVPGNGDFTFPYPTPYQLTASAYPNGGALRDLNGDGRIDIVVANHDGDSVSVFLNQGAFNFTASEIPLGAQANDVTAADVNGDGKPDLIVAGSHAGSDDLYYLDGSVSVFPGHGDGTFGSPAQYPVRNGAWRVVVGDFTHDGVLDVATANRSAKLAEDYCGELWDTVSILPGNAGGTFGAAASFTLTPQTNLADTRFRNSVMTLASVDVNADGYPDLVASWGAVILSQPPDPNWPPTVTANASAIDSSGSIQLTAPADDVDQDALTYTWSDSGGQWIEPTATPCRFTPSTGGPHAFTVTVDDGHGHTASSSVTVDFGTSSGGGSGPTITVTAPTAGETVAGGVPYTIHWTTSSDISGDDLLFTYSTDNGTTWTHISECDYSVASKGQCTWNNPGPDSTQAFVMICNRDSDVGHTCGAAGPFTIKSATGLPYPWQSGDIGAVGAAGSATYSNGVFTVTGSGADIWGAADAFQYVRQLRNTDPGPDFELDTFVESVQNVNAWTKAGLMVRSTLDAGSMHASVFVTPGKGIAFQRRTTAGGTSVNTQIASITAPVWLRLTVTRNRVDAFYRKTATDNWAPIGSQLYSSPSGYPFAYAGLAVTSHSDGTLARATFSHVAIDPAPPALTFARIGTATGDGSQDLINNTVSMTARGADIWGTADQFTYGSIPWSGDGTITTEVRLLDNTSSWAKAGPMFRDGTDVGSPHVSLFVTPGKGIAMQYRATAGGTSVQVAQVSGVVPVYLRLTRQGNMFTGAWSTDLSAWHTVGSISVALAASGGHAGLALTSHNTSVTADGTFADLTIQ